MGAFLFFTFTICYRLGIVVIVKALFGFSTSDDC